MCGQNPSFSHNKQTYCLAQQGSPFDWSPITGGVVGLQVYVGSDGGSSAVETSRATSLHVSPLPWVSYKFSGRIVWDAPTGSCVLTKFI